MNELIQKTNWLESVDPLFVPLPTKVIPDLPFSDYQAIPGINASILKEATPLEMVSKLVGMSMLPGVERALAERQAESVSTVLTWLQQQVPMTVPRNFARLCGVAPTKTTDAQELIIQAMLAAGESGIDCRDVSSASIAAMVKKGFVELFPVEVEETAVSDTVKDGRLQSFAVGDAVHKSILEPHLFDSDTWHKHWQLSPTKSLASEAAQEALASDPTRALITPEIVDTARRCRDAVYRHKLAAELLGLPGKSELTMQVWDAEAGVNRKCRIDRLPDDPQAGIIDLKTTRAKLLAQPFRGEVYKLGYHLQLAYYADTVKLIDGKERGTRIIAVTNHEPYICRVFDLVEAIPDLSLPAKGRDIYQERLAAFVLSYLENNFEAYENEGAFALTA